MSDQDRPAARNLFRQTLGWLQSRLAGAHEFAPLDEAEIGQMAREFQMTGAELAEVNRSGCDAAKLLRDALRAERLNYEELRQRLPGVVRDLEIHCSLCEHKRRCARDLASGAAPLGLEDYCPNAPTFADLRSEPALRDI
jgi:hypothetical protein